MVHCFLGEFYKEKEEKKAIFAIIYVRIICIDICGIELQTFCYGSVNYCAKQTLL